MPDLQAVGLNEKRCNTLEFQSTSSFAATLAQIVLLQNHQNIDGTFG